MGKLIIKRNNSLVLIKKMRLFLDNKIAGDVYYGDNEYFEVKNGIHKLKIKYGNFLGMSNEIEITITKERSTTIELRNSIFSTILFIIGLVTSIIILISFRNLLVDIITILALIILTIITSKKRYIIKEIEEN